MVGDICGIISGSAAAVIALEAAALHQSLSLRIIQLLLSALVAALTILGNYCRDISIDGNMLRITVR